MLITNELHDMDTQMKAHQGYEAIRAHEIMATQTARSFAGVKVREVKLQGPSLYDRKRMGDITQNMTLL